MRQKYLTQALVLSRHPFGEASLLVTLLTEEFGIIRARAQGARKPGSKTAAALQTFSRSSISLLRGKEGWRTASAIIETNWSKQLPKGARIRAARVAKLAERLVRGEITDPELFTLLTFFIAVLADLSEEEADAAETLAALRLLHLLGYDAGETYGETHDFGSAALSAAITNRTELVTRINHGISGSGL